MSAPISARPFAYNLGSPITGTEQIGYLAIGTPTVAFADTGLTWWDGPDESLGYVIAVPVPDNTQPTPVPGVSAAVSFYRTPTLTESEFVGLAEFISKEFSTPQTFANGGEAKNWLNTAGYWTSWASISGYYLLIEYAPAFANGLITFPDHENSAGDPNPNNVGVINGSTATQIYINDYDSVGNPSGITNIAGFAGNLTLTQGDNSVTYTFASNAFHADSDAVFADNAYGDSGIGSIAVLHPAARNFNDTDVISVNYTLTDLSYSFTIDSSMFDSLSSTGGSQYGSANGTTGFTISQSANNLWNGVIGNLNNYSGVSSAFAAAGASQDYNGYMMMAQWGAGSTYTNSLAKVAFNSSHQLFITAVDGTDNNFTHQNTNDGSNLVGTFNFPVTLTFINPLIHKIDWC